MFKTRIGFASQNCQVARRRRSSTQGKLIRYPLSAVKHGFHLAVTFFSSRYSFDVER